MTEPKAKPNFLLIYSAYVFGMILILAGGYQVYSGMARARSEPPVPVVDQADGDENEMSTPVEKTYRLSFTANRWQVTALDGSPRQQLPGFLPEPPLFVAPGSPIPAREIGELLVQSMERNHYRLSRQEYLRLGRLELHGVVVFDAEGPLAGLVSGGNAPVPATRVEDRQPVVSQKPKPAELDPPATSSGGETDDILSELDPSSESFLQAMLAWKDRHADSLRAATAQQRGYRISQEKSDGSGDASIYISGKARARILADDFGQTARDKAIYLQVLINEGEESLLVDGLFGANSKKALAKWARSRFGKGELAARYEKIVEDYL